jgi:hypothetical protein
MIVVVDGTGPDSDAEYAKEMASSFCSQIFRQTAGSTYFRGPTLTGKEVSAIADRAVDAALALSAAGKPIRLAGYSRGGCTAIIAAERLKGRGKRVTSMFLFDAVDMQMSDAGRYQTISDNVDFVAHAKSARDIRFWARNPVKSRFYFYNTGRWLAGQGQLVEKSFTGTHGAVGGVPWPDIPGDGACAMAVANWMSPHLKTHGLDVTLKA